MGSTRAIKNTVRMSHNVYFATLIYEIKTIMITLSQGSLLEFMLYIT